MAPDAAARAAFAVLALNSASPSVASCAGDAGVVRRWRPPLCAWGVACVPLSAQSLCEACPQGEKLGDVARRMNGDGSHPPPPP